MNLMKILPIVLFFLLSQLLGFSQLEIIRGGIFFQNRITQGNEVPMVELKTKISSIQYDLKYAKKENFTGARLYPKSTQHSYLRLPVAQALHLVAMDLAKQGMGIIIWDAYRPYRVTQKFWRLIHDERYVAHPSKGSGHNRGIAVDLTLYDLQTGTQLEMPTDFDDFSDKAHHNFTALSALQIKNRSLLQNTMEKFGFLSFETEWWHYSWPDPKKFSILDLSFDELSKLDDASGK
jgi:D-alanyl-D-alanine dipeptidase